MDMKAAGALSAYAYQSALAQKGNAAPGRGPALSQARAAEPRAPVQVATTAPEQPQRGASLDLLA
jgi:hypothetical protein